MRRFQTIVATLALLALSGAQSATLSFDFGNGFDDATPATPVGGNPGTTLGEQRRVLFQSAGDVWGRTIVSSIPITVKADFVNLSCDGNDAGVASAAPSGVFANPNLMGGTVLYPPALEDALVGRDVDPTTPDIIIEANSLIDAPPAGCNAEGFYYGLDNNSPPGKLSLFNTVLHELAHGLGFISTVQSNGSFAFNLPAIYDVFVFDLDDNQLWKDMGNGQRSASATDDPNVVWSGATVTSQFPGVITAGANGGRMRLHAPAGFLPGTSSSHFSSDASPDLLMEPILSANLGAGQIDLTAALLQDLGYQINFPADTNTLTVALAGAGAGSVSSIPAGIGCGANCSADFDAGTVVTLTAAPEAGSTFAGWSGDCSANGNVTLSANRSCTATFTVDQQSNTLSVNFAGDGSGSVTSVPAGIDCDADCDATFVSGTVVILTDAPDGGSVFDGWSGDCDAAGQVTLSADRSCTATFSLAQETRTLTVSVAGAGAGSVSSNPAGIDCGADCSASFVLGTSVTLTQNPSPGSIAAGFTGPADCSDGEVTMSRDLACVANFDVAGTPEFRVAPLLLDFVDDPTLTLDLFNDGGAELFVQFAAVGCSENPCDVSWIEVAPPAGTDFLIAPNDRDTLGATVDFATLNAVHTGAGYAFVFLSNDPRRPIVTVPLRVFDDTLFLDGFEAFEAGPPVRVEFTRTTVALAVGESFQFSAQAFDADDNPVPADLNWTSSNPSIASISDTGLVTAESAGTVSIGVNVGGRFGASIQLTVTAAEPVRAEFVEQTGSLTVGETFQFTAQAFDADDNPVDGDFTWGSSQPGVATISDTGLVTAVGSGFASINLTLAVPGGTTVISTGLLVTAPPVRVAFVDQIGSLAEGETFQFTAQAFDADDNPVPADLNWTSSNPSIASISDTGLVTAEAVGTASIGVNVGGRFGASVQLTVNPAEGGPATQLRFTDFPTALEAGESFQFQVQAFDADDNPVDAAVTWQSGDDAIATVNSVGLVTGVAVGGVSIGVMLDDVPTVMTQTFLQVTASEDPAALIAHWMFEDDAQDSSGGGHDGVLSGNAGFSAGQFGRALDLRSGDGWVDIASPVLGGLQSCSMSVWIRVESLVPDDDCCKAIFAEDRFETGALHNNILFADPTVVEWVVSGSSGESAPPPTIGEWVHYAWTYDAASSEHKTYFQGALAMEQVIAGPLCGSEVSSTIGAWDQRGDDEVIRFFDGQIDEVRFYDGILSPADVLNLLDVNRVYP